MNILAVIPARGGSKGVVNKNIRLLNGKPLIAWTIASALAAPRISRVIVSTDCPKIGAIAREAGAEVPGLRPPELAEDHTATEPVLLHALDTWATSAPPDFVMLLQPTSPLRLPHTIEAAISKLLDSKADSLLSVCASHAFFWTQSDQPCASYDYKNRPRRQDILPQDVQYRETGSIYLTRTEVLRRERNRLGGNIVLYETEQVESWEIDTEVDFQILEALMKANLP